MSHELRTPLNGVLGFAQLMSTTVPAPTPEQQRSIEQILKGGWYLLRLINEILDLSMIESGRVSLSQESISVLEVLNDCRELIEPLASTRHVTVNFPNAAADFFVLADRTRVKQVLINLLANAVKYNGEGGSVTVHCDLQGEGRMRISVSDTGAGLTTVQLAQLFQPFNRLGQENNNTEGTGIGLVVTKQLIELMGGAIGVESEVGSGTTFWVELNTALKPVLDVVRHEAVLLKHEAAASGQKARRTVLYIEDNPANLELVEQLIARRPDLKLLTAIDANLGIELACAYLPDVILMDINLPGLSGYGALAILRADPRTAAIPVLALSANAIPRDIQQGLESGFFRYLTKPIIIPLFMESLDVALAQAQQQRQELPLAATE